MLINEQKIQLLQRKYQLFSHLIHVLIHTRLDFCQNSDKAKGIIHTGGIERAKSDKYLSTVPDEPL